jgi:hypothetical protein
MTDVKSVYLWANGMVMTFNAAGQQIPELQGRYTPELEAAIRARSDAATEWYGFNGVPCVWKNGAV